MDAAQFRETFTQFTGGEEWNNMYDQEGNIVAANKKGSDYWQYFKEIDDRCVVDGDVYCDGEKIR